MSKKAEQEWRTRSSEKNKAPSLGSICMTYMYQRSNPKIWYDMFISCWSILKESKSFIPTYFVDDLKLWTGYQTVTICTWDKLFSRAPFRELNNAGKIWIPDKLYSRQFHAWLSLFQIKRTITFCVHRLKHDFRSKWISAFIFSGFSLLHI